MAANENDFDEARMITGTRVFDAPRELVFDTWTDAKHISNWWGPRGFTTTTSEMDVRPGGTWRFVMHGPDGTDYDNEIVYLEVDRPRRLVYTHGPAPVFDVTVTFEEVAGGKTRMTMHSIFATAEIRDQVAEEFGAVEGMHQMIERLEEELAKKGAFVISRAFPAPRDLVFRVWTERDHLMHWWGPKGVTITHCTNDPRPGGMMHYSMRWPGGDEMWGRWIYREITPPDRLVYIGSFSDPEGGLTRHPGAPEWPLQLLTMITFDEQDGGTLVTMTWAPYEASELERATFDGGHDSMRGGWTGTLDRLGEHLSTQK